jgi:Concanavalin A-like lectin/glucanases superfamily
MKQTFFVLLLTLCYGAESKSQRLFYESFDFDTVKGVKGRAGLFDGYFTQKEYAASTILSSPNFTISAWIAPQEYASTVAAIVDKETEFKTGYLFGINQYGRLVANVAVNNKWLTLVSTESLQLLKWTHVAMKVDSGKSISIFINGKPAGSIALEGPVVFCDTCKVSIGVTQTKTTAANTERATSAFIKTNNRFDGLIDELYIYPNALSETEIAQNYGSVKVSTPQPLQYRQMPSGSNAPAKFGAYYTKLQYAPGWDALWRGSEYPDIVVRFDNSPVKFVFWRGTGYIPAIVNEKNMWSTDQSLEHYGTGECYEAMGDKQARYTHVRIIENTPARVVIHWRYALAGIKHQLLPEDENGWSDWTDEYWTIYPDGIAARKQVLWSKRYETDRGQMQWQETIFFCQPGTRPQDNVEMKAITFMDMQGNKESYSWEKGPPDLKVFDKPAYQPIELVNFKAGYKPFNIFNEKRICAPFSFGNMKEYTTFPNWNHWPVQQVMSDGRNAVAPDKPSHASLTDSDGKTQIVEKKDDGSYWACMLKGMTDKPIDSLAALAKSWNFAPAVSRLSAGLSSVYDKYSRAYNLTARNADTKEISFILTASTESPVYNIPLVIDNWNAHHVQVIVNGKTLKAGNDFTTGSLPGLEINKLIIFVKIKSVTPLTVKLISK